MVERNLTEMNCGIYKITIGDNRFYYGSSKDLKSRKRQHISSLKKGTHQNIRMQRAWNKYKVFAFEIIEYCEPNVRFSIEQQYLDKFIKHKYSMNCAPFAGGGCRTHLTKEHKDKIAKSLTGHKRSKEEKDKLRYKRSAETIAKMRVAQNNKTPETIAKISNSLKGHAVSEETRNKLRIKSRKITDEQVRMIRQLHATGNYTYTQISTEVGVCRHNVSKIANGKLWVEII